MNDYPGAEVHLLDPEVMFSTNDHQAIVIHKTAGDASPAAVYQTFKRSAQLPRSNGNWGRSAHYAIGTKGEIWQMVPEAKGAGANGQPDSSMDPFWQPFVQRYGNLNLCTISIEHCDPSPRNDTPLTSQQKEASFRLIAHLTHKYAIPASHIKPHNSICRTGCPGNYPMEELIQFVKTEEQETDMLQITDPFAEENFKQTEENNGLRWHCISTNKDIFGGILGFYRRIGGAPRLPLTGEQYDIPGVAYQLFEAGVIVYDPKHKMPDHPDGFDPAYLLKHDSELGRKLFPDF